VDVRSGLGLAAAAVALAAWAETAAAPAARPASPGPPIVFESTRDGDADIYVINPDGSGLRQLTKNTVPDSTPSWSPAGDRIAFASQ
jgi:dipeptidyl aminopeptidase/acylaminoacyl peptidase